jgi:hypothetical protein
MMGQLFYNGSKCVNGLPGMTPVDRDNHMSCFCCDEPLGKAMQGVGCAAVNAQDRHLLIEPQYTALRQFPA